jgi:hypothetical protein
MKPLSAILSASSKAIFALALFSSFSIFFFSSEASADGSKLLKDCQEVEYFIDNQKFRSPDNQEIGQFYYCVGMTEGVRSSLVMFNKYLPKNMRACFPGDGIMKEQSIRVVLKFLRENPNMLHQEDALLIWLAYIKAFPCK